MSAFWDSFFEDSSKKSFWGSKELFWKFLQEFLSWIALDVPSVNIPEVPSRIFPFKELSSEINPRVDEIISGILQEFRHFWNLSTSSGVPGVPSKIHLKFVSVILFQRSFWDFSNKPFLNSFWNFFGIPLEISKDHSRLLPIVLSEILTRLHQESRESYSRLFSGFVWMFFPRLLPELISR